MDDRNRQERVADYLKAEGWESEVIFEELLEEYNHVIREDGRVELKEPWERRGIILQPPEDHLLDDVKEYLQDPSAASRLRKLGEMLSEYEHENVPYDGWRLEGRDYDIEVDYPTLGEVAEELDGLEEGSEDRELLLRNLRERSSTAGTHSRTIYYDGEHVVLEEEDEEGDLRFITGERPGEFIPLFDVVEIYEDLKKYGEEVSAEFWDSIETVYGAGSSEHYKVFHDPENSQVLLLDLDTIDLAKGGEEILRWIEENPEKFTNFDFDELMDEFTRDDGA